MPKATTAKSSPRARRTKAEIQHEFSAIQDEMETARESADAKAARETTDASTLGVSVDITYVSYLVRITAEPAVVPRLNHFGPEATRASYAASGSEVITHQ